MARKEGSPEIVQAREMEMEERNTAVPAIDLG